MEQVQIVLLLRGDASRAWTAPEVAGNLGTPPESTAMRLFLLASNGILAFEGPGVPRYRYACSDASTAQIIDEIAEVYASNRRLIGDVIDAPPADPVRSFADAFKLKK